MLQPGAYSPLPFFGILSDTQDPSMPVQLSTIARNTFIEAIRQPIFFVIVGICGLLQLFNTFNTAFQMGYSDSSEVSGDNKFLFDMGLATVFICGVLLAAFIATAVVSREIENKTVLTVVSKPVSRITVILGKYLGVAGAMLLAAVPMLIFLLLSIRHGVLSNAADSLDGPVWIFTTATLAVVLGVALWCNFFYGWYFTQTAMVLLAPGMVLAYMLVLLVSKKWEWQPIITDLKPQIILACIALTQALLVLTAVATAVSTRLGQVMTIVVCGGIFLFGLLNNYLIGRHVFSNTRAGIIREVLPEHFTHERWTEPGHAYSFALQNSPNIPIRVGDNFFYSNNPSGFPLTPAYATTFTGNFDTISAAPGGGLVVTEVDGLKITVRRFGRDPLRIPSEPLPGDYIFTQPTQIRPVAMVLWSVVPNMHYFWLVDAVSQNQLIPYRHLALVSGYAISQIIVFLALGVVLFQKRDVG
jgi:ABC-2 type transport system permease protein